MKLDTMHHNNFSNWSVTSRGSKAGKIYRFFALVSRLQVDWLVWQGFCRSRRKHEYFLGQ